MYPVTTEFQNKIKENARVFKAIVQIQHSAGVLNLTDKDIIGGSMMFNEASQAGEDFTIGSVVASTFSIKLVNKPEYAAINFEGATIIPQIGLLLRENIDTENYFINAPQPSEFEEGDGEEIWEYVPLGRFNIDEAKKLRNTVEIKAIDNMIEFDKPYSLSNLSYPASLYQIYVNACNACDAIVGATDFPNKDYIVDNRPEGEYTFRDIIGYVAALSGTFARCNRNGATELTWYKDTEIELGPQNRFSFLPREDLIKITGVRFETEDSVYLTGTDDYVVDLSDNPLLQGEYETVLPNIFNNIKDIAFTPFESSWQGNPALQAGDIITQTDRDGDVYNTVITHSTYKYRGASSFSGKGLPLKAKGYRGSTNKKIAKVRRVLEDSFNRRINEMQKVIEDGMIVTYYQVEEPDDAKRGDLWYDSENEKLKRYDGLTWALITDKGIVEAIEKAQDAQSTADGKIVTYYQVEEPNGSIGDLWIDINDNNKLYRFDGEEWIDIQDKNITDLIDAITDINSDISTLETAVLNATELIANMLGGYAHYEAEAFYVSDNPVLAEAQKVWKWGIGGFGYSENGIEGPYTTAITADGSIVAMNIAAKIIAASMVRTGILQSEDGSTWINLDNGEFNFKNAIKWVNGQLVIEGMPDTGAKIFNTTPVPPYKLNDLWKVSGVAGVDFKICTTARETGSYLASHWTNVTDSKSYTDAIKNLTAGTAIAGGNLTIDRDKIRINHSSGIYSQFDLFGVYKQYASGQGNYLNDIFVAHVPNFVRGRSSQTSFVNVDLPMSFKGREGEVEVIIAPAGMRWETGEINDRGRAIWMTESSETYQYYSPSRSNWNPTSGYPYISVRSQVAESYHDLSFDKDRHDIWYHGMDFLVLIIGK